MPITVYIQCLLPVYQVVTASSSKHWKMHMYTHWLISSKHRHNKHSFVNIPGPWQLESQ